MKAVLITGSAGKLGSELVRRFHQDGYCVFGTDRSSSPPLKDYVAGDLQDFNFRVELIEQYLAFADSNSASELGLINNAAFVGTTDVLNWSVEFADQSVDAFLASLEVNVVAPFHLTQLLHARSNTKLKWVINIASIYGVVGPQFDLYSETTMNNPAGYAAGKGALLSLTNWLAARLAPNVRVNAVSPGGIIRNQPLKFRERYEERTPLRRMATEEDITAACTFLASKESSYITGHNLVVDGGFTSV